MYNLLSNVFNNEIETQIKAESLLRNLLEVKPSFLMKTEENNPMKSKSLILEDGAVKQTGSKAWIDFGAGEIIHGEMSIKREDLPKMGNYNFKILLMPLIESVRLSEMAALQRLLNQSEPSKTVLQNGDLSVSSLNYAFMTLEAAGVKADITLINPLLYGDVRLYGRDVFSGLMDMSRSWCYGDLWYSKVYAFPEMDAERVVYIFPKSNIFCYDEGSSVVFSEIYEGLKIEYFNKLQMGLINREHLACIRLTNPAV